MKIGLVCDSHVGGGEKSPQKAYLIKAVELMKKDGIDISVHLGDVTAFGEVNVFDDCVSRLKQINNSYVLLGNADVRKKDDKDKVLSRARDVSFSVEGRTFLGLNVVSSTLCEEDFNKMENLCDGDVLMMHFGVHSLVPECKERMERILHNRALTVIHAHSHKWFDYNIGKSRVVGLRALDPDKSIGDYPCITYFDTENDNFIEKIFSTSKEVLQDVSSFFGISCADNERELSFAILHGIKGVELRMSVVNNSEKVNCLIEEWRAKTNGYLSAHMPNLKVNGENIEGEDEWLKALELAISFNVNSLTVHPPKIKKSTIYSNKELLERLVNFYSNAFSKLDKSVKIGIENIHKTKAETEARLTNEELGFGYVPEDVLFLVGKINEKFGYDRVGVVLDVGHTKNNGNLSSIYTVGRWYEMVGSETVAYHIHQVLSTENGMKNHNAIENWFGPLISYASFFYSWEKDVINRAPVFLEMRGGENYLKSIDAFNKLL